jgi:hypothetical protein
MLEELNIYNPTLRERFDRAFVKPIITAKYKLGMGVGKTVWTNALADELHKPVIKKFQKRKVYVKGIDEIWAADLVDMSAYSKQNKHIKYLLAVIDVFSKYGWMVPLKNKTGEAVAEAFELIFSQRKPTRIWLDKGKEFYNLKVKNLFKANEIEMYSTENEEKSCVVERWNRTMKERMFKYFTANDTTKYYNILDEMVDKYNNTYHSSIKMTPVEASQKGNENKVYRALYSDLEPIDYTKPKFSVGDRVRITKKKTLFEKGYTSRWVKEIFVISEVLYTVPITYKIKALDGEVIIGSFYEPELQKSKF